MIKKILLSLFIFVLLTPVVNAETLYVTDRILLGMHQEASEASPVFKTITSGTAAIVLQRNESFIKIKLADGTEGWVSKNYLKKEKTAATRLNAVNAKLEKERQTNKKLAEDMVKKNREVQLHRDTLANAKTTIKDLKKALKKSGKIQLPAENPEALTKANESIKLLEAKIAKLEEGKMEIVVQSVDAGDDDSVSELEKLQNENQQFQARIQVALASLSGDAVPSAAELAAIRPSFPFWYWLLLLALLLVGMAAGVIAMDLLHRRKHGGFRL